MNLPHYAVTVQDAIGKLHFVDLPVPVDKEFVAQPIPDIHGWIEGIVINILQVRGGKDRFLIRLS